MFTELFEKLPDGAFWPVGKWWKEFADMLDRDRARLVQTSGSELPDASGRWFDLRSSKGGSGAAAHHPFQLIDASETVGSTFVPKLQVNIDSWLMGSVRAADKKTITGLGSPFEVANDTYIYLRINLAASTYSIVHGALWADYDAPVKFTGSGVSKTQTDAYALIGYVLSATGSTSYPDRLSITVSDSEKLEVIQCMHTNQILCRTCFEGDTVLLPFPYNAPGPGV